MVRQALLRLLRGGLHLVVSSRANLARFVNSTGLTVRSVIRVPERDAFPRAFDEHRTAWRRYGQGDGARPQDARCGACTDSLPSVCCATAVIVLLCGPLGRILAVEWFLRVPTATFLVRRAPRQLRV